MTIKKIITLLFLLLLIVGCNKKTSKVGVVHCSLPEIKDRFDKVQINMWGYDFLGDTIRISDTVNVKDGKFEYHFNIPEPKITSFILFKKGKVIGDLCLHDKNTRNKRAGDGNILLGNEEISIKHFITEDIMQKGYSFFQVDVEEAHENELFNQFEPKRISLKLIKENPSSYGLLYQLFFQKKHFSNERLSEMMDLFSDNLKEATSFKILRNYLDRKIDLENHGYAKNFNWQDIDGKTYDFKTALNEKKYALLVFWASWCGPCRSEITEIKEFSKKYSNKVSIISMSIDDDYNRWKNAVEKEQMPWLNLSGLPKRKNAIKKEYNIDAVPNLILLDKNGKMLMNNLNELDKIDDYIKQHK